MKQVRTDQQSDQQTGSSLPAAPCDQQYAANLMSYVTGYFGNTTHLQLHTGTAAPAWSIQRTAPPPASPPVAGQTVTSLLLTASNSICSLAFLTSKDYPIS
jgi:hypothetical protein